MLRSTLLYLLLLPGWLLAQTDTLRSDLPDTGEQLVEDFIRSTEGEEENFDFNTAFELLDAYRERPLDLNRATEAELRDMRLLDDGQINSFLAYRDRVGDLVNIYELQAVPAMDLNAIRQLLPFVRVGGEIDDLNLTPGQMLAQGNRELFLRWNRVLEEQRGFALGPEDATNYYLGDPNQFYVRFRQRYSNRLSFGFTAEKDRGEEFFTGSNRKGFDYYSAHFFLRNLNRTFRAIALGDYNISLGQGLLLNTGFGYGKSILVTSTKRGGQVVRPYSGVNESQFLRGAAVTLGLGEQLEFTAFASRKGQDANLLDPDTLDTGEILASISSIDIDGLHRTPAEIADRNAIQLTTAGGNLRWNSGRQYLSLNVLYNTLDKPLELRQQVYNRFYFQGDRLLNVSLDYGLRYRNFTFFGETGYSDNGSIATLNGLLVGLSRFADLSLYFRSYPRDFQTLQARPFGEGSNGRNETGLYLGLDIRLHPNWKLAIYHDIWNHPWPLFNADTPSTGSEYRARLTYWQKRKLEVYVEVLNEVKERNVELFESNFEGVIPNRRFQARLHFSVELSKALEWRTRADWGLADNPVNNRQTGYHIYQDLLFKPIGFPLSFTARFATFDTDGYAVRFYNYESGLLYNFRVLPYYNRGNRVYLNLRYKGIRNLTIEARIAQLIWTNEDQIGSGLEATGRPTRTEVGAQVKYSF
jgi:hypothetical protein